MVMSIFDFKLFSQSHFFFITIVKKFL